MTVTCFWSKVPECNECLALISWACLHRHRYETAELAFHQDFLAFHQDFHFPFPCSIEDFRYWSCLWYILYADVDTWAWVELHAILREHMLQNDKPFVWYFSCSTSFLPSWVILVCCVNVSIPNQLIIASHFFIHTYHAWLLRGGWGNIILQEDLIVCVFVHTASGSRSRNRNELS